VSSDSAALFDKEQLDVSFGGEVNFKGNYDHATYWESEGGIVKLALERKSKAFENWVSKGSKVGTSEWDIKET